MYYVERCENVGFESCLVRCTCKYRDFSFRLTKKVYDEGVVGVLYAVEYYGLGF